MQEPVKTSFSNDVETTALKIPPHSIEAEQAVLGGSLLAVSFGPRESQLRPAFP